MSLKNLEEDDTIVIRNSDKGGLVVVMNVHLYRKEAICQLSESSTYIELRGILLSNIEPSLQDSSTKG